ncbi:MAG: antibiotic biosynthesis monooxygenase [Betaproteobacteria bacterium]|nr:antibiotic biosynthesis monooxygenase [Betaproteobacteria bacterium]
MIACIIEFGVKPGAEEEHQAILKELMVEVATIDGFISKETFDSRNNPGKVITVSYWRDALALDAWMKNKPHVRAIPIGKRRLFTHYHIQIAEVLRDNVWQAGD